MAAQASCQPSEPLASIALVHLQLREENSIFTPLKPPPSEEAAPTPAPVAAPTPAKAAAKGPPAKAPAASAAKGPAKGAAAVADQLPPVGAPELGRALELIGAQVQEYYAWRESATVHDLPAEHSNSDDLAGFRSILSGMPEVRSSFEAYQNVYSGQLVGLIKMSAKLHSQPCLNEHNNAQSAGCIRSTNFTAGCSGMAALPPSAPECCLASF